MTKVTLLIRAQDVKKGDVFLERGLVANKDSEFNIMTAMVMHHVEFTNPLGEKECGLVQDYPNAMRNVEREI
jgi:hypothetical protein